MSERRSSNAGLVGTMTGIYVPSLKGMGSLLSESDVEDDPQQLLARAEAVIIEIEMVGVLSYVWSVLWGIFPWVFCFHCIYYRSFYTLDKAKSGRKAHICTLVYIRQRKCRKCHKRTLN